jgi:type IV pilus assembly protein PilX
MSHSYAVRAVKPPRQRGMALISGLLLLLVVTIIALSMFRSFGMQEKIAGNTREKARALNAAISAQQYAENWLASGAAPSIGGVCAGGGLVSSNVGLVCSNTPDSGFSVQPWTIGGVPQVGVRFDNFTLQNVTGSATAIGSWYQPPQYYVTWLGKDAGGNIYYQIDALGWGATPNSVAVVESTYELVSPGGSLDKGGPVSN